MQRSTLGEQNREGGIVGRLGSDHPTENTGKLSIVYADCVNDACASRAR